MWQSFQADDVRPDLAMYAGAISEASGLGVPSDALARHFGVTPGYIRVLAHRGRRPSRQPSRETRREAFPFSIAFKALPEEALRRFLGTRAASGSMVLDGSERRRISMLEARIDVLDWEHWDRNDLLAGLAALEQLTPLIGFAGRAEQLRLAARLHTAMARLSVHVGITGQGLRHARRSMMLSHVVHLELGDRVDLRRYADAALIAATAAQMQADVGRARVLLGEYSQARVAAGAKLSAEYFRHRGAALLQEGRDDLARKEFVTAMNVKEEEQPKSVAEVVMMGERQAALLRPVNWEKSLELLDQAARLLPTMDRLHRVLFVHWAAGCGLSIDSPAANERALLLLSEHSADAARFGLQAARSRLLGITPLLPPEHRSAWVRRALYAYVYRQR